MGSTGPTGTTGRPWGLCQCGKCDQIAVFSSEGREKSHLEVSSEAQEVLSVSQLIILDILDILGILGMKYIYIYIYTNFF